MFNVRPKETASLITQDGVRLDADIYRPDADGHFPVLLMRQPYSRAIASTVVYAHPRWYAAQGYIVVIQDVRGRGTSEGEFNLFAHEVQDGYETILWAANLPGSTGHVGMYGFSYQGMTQLYAASSKPAALKTICPAMVAYDLYTDWAYEGGAFCFQTNLAWALQLATETARRRGDQTAYQALYAACQNLPLHDPVPGVPEILQQFAPDSFYHQWINHPDPDEYWQRLNPQLTDVNLPMLHIGGWFDPHLRGTLRCYQTMVAQTQEPQYLLVGPWAHLPWGQRVGAINYGTEAANFVDTLQIQWFNQFLKGIDTGLLQENPVCLFEMGSNQWRDFERFPTGSEPAYVLTSTGLANLRSDAGTLIPYSENLIASVIETPPQEGFKALQHAEITPAVEYPQIHLTLPKITDIWVHDPWRPAPSRGGHGSLSPGTWDRSDLEDRTDVVTYTTAPLNTDLVLAGIPRVKLFVSADHPSFDLCVVLSEVWETGQVFNITQGYVRRDTPRVPIHIELQPTCMKVLAGHRLRLSISAACFPAYLVNSGTGVPGNQAQLMNREIITLTLTSGDQYPSQLLLPIVASKTAN